MNGEIKPATLWKRDDNYMELLLSYGLGGESWYLPEEVAIDETGRFDTFTTLGGTAVDLYLVSDAGEDSQIFNSGILFRGSIVGAKMEMTAKEMNEQDIHAEIADHLGKFHVERDETRRPAVW